MDIGVCKETVMRLPARDQRIWLADRYHAAAEDAQIVGVRDLRGASSHGERLVLGGRASLSTLCAQILRQAEAATA